MDQVSGLNAHDKFNFLFLIKTMTIIKKINLLLLLLLVLAPLAFASSHYTFEHAEEMRYSGRIDWQDYGPDPFNQAVEENKPIFLLLSAPSWCYWCHVYTSDDYVYHPDVYPTINQNFIPIYVDADKRQDLTRKYLEGGWPSTTVMTPNGDRLFGYSGPRPIQNMLVNLNQAVEHVNTNGFANTISYQYQNTTPIIPNPNQLNGLINGYAAYTLQSYDSLHGGFGSGQKFPQGRALDFALEIYETAQDQQFLDLVQNTLVNQYTQIDELETNYNLYDPVEGGFHRYGTQRDWTPPHYEKMLYDNAKLLRVYAHLQQLTPNDEIVDEVVEKTHNYIKTSWYDPKGGFYGNTDVHGEHHYYAKNPRPDEKPRVEKTKYTDWNTEAILTYLSLWQQTENNEYKEMAEKSLDFFSKEIVTDKGPYHYIKEDGSKGVRGNLLDNAFMLLAFTEGYAVLEKQDYLDTANQIAQYSLDNLYDWNSGGFFERNSQDLHLYAPGENIDLSQPNEENAIIAYALLKLYQQTGNIEYLNAGLKTLGKKISGVGGLDSGYYFVKSAQLVLEGNLLSEYNNNLIEIERLEQEKLANFWVNDLVVNQEPVEPFVVSDEGIEKLQAPVLLIILIAFIAGLLSFVSPCTLPILPAYVAYSFEISKRNVKTMTLAFFLGLATVFTLLGMTATLIGNFLKSNLTIFSQVAGLAIIFFGIYILLGRGFSGFKIKQNKPKSYLGAFIFGSILGLSWTPCIGPILVAILLLASTAGSAISGGLLLFSYAIGIALPLLLFSTYLSKLNRNGNVWRFIKGKELKFNLGKKVIRIHTTSLISGILFIVLGYLIFSGTLFIFNQYVGSSSFQQWIFAIEERLLDFVR